MSAKDTFSAKLLCPQCGRAGRASLWEFDGSAFTYKNQKTFVSELSEGFKEVQQRSNAGSIDLFCAQCNVSAIEEVPSQP
jgi:hypothetical protein